MEADRLETEQGEKTQMTERDHLIYWSWSQNFYEVITGVIQMDYLNLI